MTRPTTRTAPYTGAEYLESLRDGREVWIDGERVADVTAHPAPTSSSSSASRNTTSTAGVDGPWLEDPLPERNPDGRRARW